MAQHISVRVPWHDDGWKGTVCQDPSVNIACLRLKNIHENRNDDIECELCGECMVEHEQNLPCIEEGGAFMSPNELHKSTVHRCLEYDSKNPYKSTRRLNQKKTLKALWKFPDVFMMLG